MVDITVEDPSDNFVRLRDYVDTKNCLPLKAFSKEEVSKEQMNSSLAYLQFFTLNDFF